MTLEIRIPISPEPHFFRQVEYIARACSVLGALAEARIVVSVGGDCEPCDLYALLPWSRGRVVWRWVDRELIRAQSYHANGKDRFRYPTDADYVLLLDADTLILRSFNDLLASLEINPVIAGVMAHAPPFTGLKSSWRDVFAALGKPFPTGRFEHTGWATMYGPPYDRFGPAYFNFGVVFVPGSVVTDLGKEYERQFERSPSAPIHPYFAGQVAFMLAIYELGLPHVALPLRYNFPNYAWADQRQQHDLVDVRIIHYLAEDTIGTRRDTWGTDANFQFFLSRKDLSGANEVLRQAALTLAAMPFASRE